LPENPGFQIFPPEGQAQILQILYTIRSERQLMEQLDYNMLFRWFVGLSMDDEVWHPTTFTQNRDRLLNHEVAETFFEKIRNRAEAAKLVSREHFSLDGTLIDAAASLKSFQPREAKETAAKDDEPPQDGGRNPSIDFHGEKRTNQTHVSRTDPESLLARKGRGKESRMSYAGHLLTENRNGLILDAELGQACGNAERDEGLILLKREARRNPKRRKTVGADKGYDKSEFVKASRRAGFRPHFARWKYTTIDKRTTRHKGYEISQRRRKIIEQCFGWMKTAGLMRKARHRGKMLVRQMFIFAAAAYNLIRMRKLGVA
jgi:IS5 family transposase